VAAGIVAQPPGEASWAAVRLEVPTRVEGPVADGVAALDGQHRRRVTVEAVDHCALVRLEDVEGHGRTL